MSSLEEFAKAIICGDLAIVEKLISRGSVDVNARLPREFHPPALVYGARYGRKEIVDILLRSNARVDETDERGRTACHAAAERWQPDVLPLLLARQPNLAVVDADGRTAFDIALRHLYFQDVSKPCALMLLEAGASVESVDRFDLCSFASASTDAIWALIHRGVVVREVLTSDGRTPLHKAAVRTRDARVFDLLVNVCGIDLEARSRDGVTSLLCAAEYGNVVALRWLIEAGADVNSVDIYGSMPLFRVSRHDCAVVLLAAGANVCARDNNGHTPLHCVALAASSFTAVHSLIAGGADLDAANDAGETARQALARRGWTLHPDQVEAARREIAKTRIDFVRYRALQVCIGLQSLRLNALQMCEILQFACGALALLIPFHIWWATATTVKHFRSQ